MAISKNNRKVLATASGSYTEIGQMSRFVPLQAGMAYLRDPRDGRTYHVKVNAPRFDELVDEFVTAIGKDRIVTELEALARKFPADGWGHALHRVRHK